ncbi:MAG TPA: hypothetical protein VJT49_34535 [Amycolatopsis sp.]|uniref:hypothetical protein n=1 Tax=Amycolatopsis sp. TaxID=37632 RepID=UPI002B4A4847|nr:hypothetical protein [Amycolatopsis sp.]HKS50138.1 hypothetical protein [Amycolatopsis sp.]
MCESGANPTIVHDTAAVSARAGRAACSARPHPHHAKHGHHSEHRPQKGKYDLVKCASTYCG